MNQIHQEGIVTFSIPSHIPKDIILENLRKVQRSIQHVEDILSEDGIIYTAYRDKKNVEFVFCFGDRHVNTKSDLE